MEVTKCDRCGVYVDKSPSDMPIIAYKYRKDSSPSSIGSKSLCYECYNEFLNWIGDNKE